MENKDILLSGLLEGTAAEADVNELRTLMEGDQALSEEVARLTRIERLLRFRSYIEADQPDMVTAVRTRLRCRGAAGERFTEAVRRNIRVVVDRPGDRTERRALETLRFRIWHRVALVAAAVAIVVGGWFLASRFTQGSGVVVGSVADTTTGGMLVRGWQEITMTGGMNLRSGDRILLPEDGYAVVNCGAGDKIELSGNARVRFVNDGKTLNCIEMERGQMTASVTSKPASMPLEVLTPQALVTVVGTRFRLGVDAERTCIDVMDGLVRVKALTAGKILEVAAGQSLNVGSGEKLLVRSTAPPDCDLPVLLEESFRDSLSDGWKMAGMGYDFADEQRDGQWLRTLKLEPVEFSQPGRASVDLPSGKYSVRAEWDILVEPRRTNEEVYVSMGGVGASGKAADTGARHFFSPEPRTLSRYQSGKWHRCRVDIVREDDGKARRTHVISSTGGRIVGNGIVTNEITGVFLKFKEATVHVANFRILDLSSQADKLR